MNLFDLHSISTWSEWFGQEFHVGIKVDTYLFLPIILNKQIRIMRAMYELTCCSNPPERMFIKAQTALKVIPSKLSFSLLTFSIMYSTIFDSKVKEFSDFDYDLAPTVD